MALALAACGDDTGPGVDSGGTDSGRDAAGTDGGGGTDAGFDAGTCGGAVCDENATCDTTGGTPVCVCNDGFAGDGFDCTDINECMTMPTVCGMGTCMNEDGGYTCTCPMGYEFDDVTCTNVDECMAGTDDCADPGGVCTDTEGSFTCACDMGFTGDGRTCADIDECAMGTSTCTATQACVNTDGSFMCPCLFSRTGMSCALPSILVYDDTASPEVHAELAGMALGYPVIRTTTRAAFQAAFDAGGFGLVIYDAASSGLDAADEGRLRTHITGGGKLIFGAFNLNSFPMMQSALGVTVVSVTTPRPIHRAFNTLLDLYTQASTITSPLATDRDFADNGDELTLVGGAGLIVARFGTAIGQGAMAVTNNRQVIVNGFLPSDVGTTDVDADGMLDMVEMYRNQIAYLLNPSVLVYSQSAVTGAQNVARRLRWTLTDTTDGPTFAARTSIADVVVIDAPGSALPPEVISSLTTHITGGGRAIFSWWDLDTDAALQGTLQVTTASFDMPRPVHRIPGADADFFNLVSTARFPSPLTDPMDDFGDNGDALTTTMADGFLAAAFDTPTGPGAIAVTRSGQVIVNGFLPGDVRTANADADLLPDMEELYTNELHWLFLP